MKIFKWRSFFIKMCIFCCFLCFRSSYWGKWQRRHEPGHRRPRALRWSLQILGSKLGHTDSTRRCRCDWSELRLRRGSMVTLWSATCHWKQTDSVPRDSLNSLSLQLLLGFVPTVTFLPFPVFHSFLQIDIACHIGIAPIFPRFA